MKIYIAHSRNFAFQKELYEPIQNSSLAKEHTFVLPHSESGEAFNSKKLFEKGCDLIIAEVSYPSVGLGIELGWADILKIPVVCIYKKDSEMSGSLKVITDKFLEYSNTEELVAKVGKAIQNH